MGMGERQLEGLFEDLGSTFEAAVAREERAAADDLAMSIRQDRSSADVLASGPWSVREGELVTAVDQIGRDYVVSSLGSLLPLRRLTAVHAPGGRFPVVRRDTLLERLRDLARRNERVLVTASEGVVVEGTLLAAGRDHVLVIDGGGRRHLIGSAAIERVSRPRGSSADVP